MAITAEQLSFATVMDVSIVDQAYTKGQSYSFTAGTDTTHTLPFQTDGGAGDTALLVILNSVPADAKVDGTTAVVTIVGDDIIFTQATLITTFDTVTGLVSYSGQTTEVTTFTFPAQTEANIFNVDGSGLLPYIKPIAILESLTITNIMQEGPRKEGRGGKYNKVQVRWGKTMRLEMEDVIFDLPALGAIGGATVDVDNIKVNDLFPSSYMLVGDTFIINKETGLTEDVYLVFPDFLADGIFEINMEADGDLAVLALAGELFPNDDGDFFYITDKT